MKKKIDAVAILMAAKLAVIILFLVFMCAMMSSCTPKSAMMTRAVIIDSKPRTTDAQMWYYVNLPTYGIKDRVVSYALYEVGDTILIHDKWRNYEIR